MAATNGHAKPSKYTRKSPAEIRENKRLREQDEKIYELNKRIKKDSQLYAKFHGDPLLADKILSFSTTLHDLSKIFTFKNIPDIARVFGKYVAGKGLDIRGGAKLVGALPNNSKIRAGFVEAQVQNKYDKMLHPPLSYLGDAFQYRTVDGKFNSAIHPHLGQAQSPYAKTVPSKTHALGALPAPEDLFDRLMARAPGGRESTSGLSSMLIYHATIIIHDIFRTNDDDKNISDSSSYLDLSPLYGYTEEMQRAVRDDKYKLGLLKPDTFAEDRLLRQPAGVCIMLVMYNRYHNYAATQIYRINENGRFSIPSQYEGPRLVATAKELAPTEAKDESFDQAVADYKETYEEQDGGDFPNEDHHDLEEGGSTLYAMCVKGLKNLLETVYDDNRQEFDTKYGLLLGTIVKAGDGKVKATEALADAAQKKGDTGAYKAYTAKAEEFKATAAEEKAKFERVYQYKTSVRELKNSFEAAGAQDAKQLEKTYDSLSKSITNSQDRLQFKRIYRYRRGVKTLDDLIQNVYSKDPEQFEEAYKVLLDEIDTKDEARFGKLSKYKLVVKTLEDSLKTVSTLTRSTFEAGYDAAWNKLDEDLFQTARLITCGMYIQVSIHDYLRALMGFHQFNTDFTLDPRIAMTEHKNVSRGLGNQVTVEFNLLYRFHCAISRKDEGNTEEYMKELFGGVSAKPVIPSEMTFEDFVTYMGTLKGQAKFMKSIGVPDTKPWEQTFGLASKEKLHFTRNPITGLFDDQKMVTELIDAMDDPISNFGPRNVPRSLKGVEIMGIMQARKWEIGSLNDFREFFGMKRHQTFESITGNEEVQTALRDLYDHPDQVELYPGIFCESDAKENADPGPSELDSALWSAIFSDAITLVRSDRFYTVDWNTKSLTSWGMAQVTPDDSSILKSSVFHRLIQRAFPDWFPYDSIRFFHPFYTSQKNAEYAQAQGFAKDFRFDPNPKAKYPYETPETLRFNVERSAPGKPEKPVYLDTKEEITALLDDKTDNYVHPARFELDNLPEKIKEILEPGSKYASEEFSSDKEFDSFDSHLIKYFNDLALDIIHRESIVMNDTKPIYQIDVTRDFAIPVTTRYVADFLGIGHLVKSDKHPSAPYSENEIYQHITNCQIFLTYNTDETKLLKRRAAFRSSMKFLYDLTMQGNMLSASRWRPAQWIRTRLNALFHHTPNPMTELGFNVAQQILDHYKDTGRAAAVMLLVGLDTAYNSVLSFTSVLNEFILELYDEKQPDEWLRMQQLAYSTDEKTSFKQLRTILLDAQRRCVKLPIIRKAIKKGQLHDKAVEAGQVVICDVHIVDTPEPPTGKETDYLSYASSFSSRFSHYHPKHVAVIALTSMIKVLAQTKNLRPGHSDQGKLKKIDLDAGAEGYTNFMAPGRVRKIASQVEQVGGDDCVWTDDILWPETHTYLTAEWDEFVPFPTTWKVRFNGFGISDYHPSEQQPFDTSRITIAPFYQPTGPSHVGGSFADSICICNTPGTECKCKDEQAKKVAAAKAKAQKVIKPMPIAENADKHTILKHFDGTNGCGIGT